MKKVSSLLLGISLTVTCALATAAQEMSKGDASRPTVLQITREFVKPGKAGMAHEKAEGAFVQAMAKAKWPTYYVALTSLSGKSRVLFLTFYQSLEAWEKDGSAVDKNPTLSGELERAAMADGELLESMDQGVFLFRDEMSLRPRPDLSQFHFMEVSRYQVRPGHNKEWAEAVKMVKAGYEKGVPDAHWGMFEEHYGGEGNAYLILSGHKSLSEVDRDLMQDKQFADAMGEDGMKKLSELVAACVESSSHQLFAVSPKMSYVSDSWKKSDPDFWSPKATAAAKAPAATKKTNP